MAPEQDCLQYHTAQVYLVQNQKWLSLNQSVTALPFPQLGTIAIAIAIAIAQGSIKC